MIVNKQLLSIPPFISTSWKDVELLLSDGQHTLNIYLKNGTLVRISHLQKEQLDLIFQVHQDILLTQAQEMNLPFQEPMFFQLSGPFLEHDPDLKDSSPIPEEVKTRLASLINHLPQIENIKLPQPHPDCFCPHCQLMILLNSEQNQDDIVSDDDLKFATWIIEEIQQKQFKVIHPYNENDFHLVSLDNPIHCSCCQMDCEHIEHILRN